MTTFARSSNRLQVIKSEGRSCATFELSDEDHTVGNALRYMILKNPKVKFCGYSTPHPNERKIRIQIQMFSETESAVEALTKGFRDLMDLSIHVKQTFNESFPNNPEDDEVQK